MIVIDASALLAFLLREPGHETVAKRLNDARMSAVNFSEVLARMSREEIAPTELAPRLSELGLAVISFDQPQAVIASELREAARGAGIGLADCCCFALAKVTGLPVLTADRAWAGLHFGVDVELIR
jgi:ribonuclease VapC